MRLFLAAMGAALLVGCGVQWEGEYSGLLSLSAACGNGDMIESTSTETLDVKDFGDRIQWEEACGVTAVAIPDGDTAKVQPYKCPSFTGSTGSQVEPEATGGTVSISDKTLDLDVDVRYEITSSTATDVCTGKITGAMNRVGD